MTPQINFVSFILFSCNVEKQKVEYAHRNKNLTCTLDNDHVFKDLADKKAVHSGVSR